MAWLHFWKRQLPLSQSTMLHLLSLVTPPPPTYCPPMLRRTNPQHADIAFTPNAILWCVWSAGFSYLQDPPFARGPGRVASGRVQALIYFSWTSVCNGLKNSYIPANFLIALKDTVKSRISLLSEHFKGLNRSLGLVTVWFESRAVELCSLYNVNVPKRCHQSIENLHSHNLKFHFIETLVRLAVQGSNIASNGGNTDRKSFESLVETFESFRSGVKSSDNVISKFWEVHPVCHRRGFSNRLTSLSRFEGCLWDSKYRLPVGLPIWGRRKLGVM